MEAPVDPVQLTANTMNLTFELMSPMAQRPDYATLGSACFDIRASHPDATENFKPTWVIAPGEMRAISTGLKVSFTKGNVLQLFSRSGHAYHHQVCLANGTGIIDSDYRGEIMVMLINHGTSNFVVEQGDRIAQAMMQPVPRVRMFKGTAKATKRGEGGFGSTGSK